MHKATPLLSPPGIEQAILQERMLVRPMRKNFWKLQYVPAKEAGPGRKIQFQQTSGTSQSQQPRRQQAAQQQPLEPVDQTWQRQQTDQWQRWHHHCFGIMLQHKWPIHMGTVLACRQQVPRRVGTLWKISLSHRLQQ